MRPIRIHIGICLIAIALFGCSPAAPQLPQVTDLPAGYHFVGELAGRGLFYAASERPEFRIDDGNHYHGYDGPLVWAQDEISVRTQGLLYGIDDGAIVSAGYLVRQADLAASKSLHGLTLRELDLPVAYSMTIDLIEIKGVSEIKGVRVI